jgi:hydroxymethylpyrimidine pyrophosphatase-like HAD family hydrolase/fructoselysine-6-P-deglycase FrlB-like protein
VGRPFDSELSKLRDTYSFACALPIGELATTVRGLLDRSLVCVGSGGSFTAAALLQRLHHEATGIPSLALTPLDFEALTSLEPTSAIWLLSARGKNTDILTAASNSRRLEPASIISLTADINTKLGVFVESQACGQVHQFRSPSGKDGYLATNSLLATCVLLVRAYQVACSLPDKLPTFAELLGADDIAGILAEIDAEFAKLFWARESIVLLHGAGTSVTAIDIESKVTEAALAFLVASDLRNFAHGRHHWLSRFGDSACVIAIADPYSVKLAERTMRLFPQRVPSRLIRTNHGGPWGEVEGIIRGFLLVASLGHAKGIDPGRPGVAQFGRSIYHIRQKTSRLSASGLIDACAARKIQAGMATSIARAKELAQLAMNRFSEASFGAVLLDLDGTLVGTKPTERWVSHGDWELRAEIIRLQTHGIRIAIATGRGPSDTTFALLRSFFDEDSWQNVLIGFYNGAQIGYLSDDKPRTLKPLEEIDRKRLMDNLKHKIRALTSEATLKETDFQLTLRSATSDAVVRPHQLFLLAQEAISECGAHAKVVQSSHSVDVVHFETSKTAVAAEFRKTVHGDILRIGDSGAWPGNDFELLSDEHALSVNRVSADQEACWNLLPRGKRAVEGTLHYLQRLADAGQNRVSFDCRLQS